MPLQVNDAEAAVDSPPGPALTRIEGGEGGGDGGARAWEIAFAAASAAASAAAQGGQPAPYRMVRSPRPLQVRPSRNARWCSSRPQDVAAAAAPASWPGLLLP